MTSTRVRIAVAVSENGESAWWGGVSLNNGDMEAESLDLLHQLAPGERREIVWVEADIPLPSKPQTIEGEVQTDG